MPPRFGSGEWAALLAALALAGAAAAQFALPSRTELPEDPGLAPRRVRLPAAAQVPEYPAVLRTPLFSPDRAPGEFADGATGDSGSNLQLVGMAAGGRIASALIRGPDGAVHVLEPGQSLQDWRLQSITPTGVVLTGPGGRLNLILGGAPPKPANASPPASKTSASEPQP